MAALEWATDCSPIVSEPPRQRRGGSLFVKPSSTAASPPIERAASATRVPRATSGTSALSRRVEVMIIRGTIAHIHATDIATKRGSTVLTSVRVIDDQVRVQHGMQPGVRPSPTRYEVQFIDGKQFLWSEAIRDEFAIGDEILAYAEDEIRVRTTDGGVATLIVHGIDLGLSTLPVARRPD